MSPYKIEILWQFEGRYMITILGKNNRKIAQYECVPKEDIPSVLEKYLCVGAWEV